MPDPSTFPAPHQWATFSPSRSPNFKTHSTLGQVKNALSGKRHYSGGLLEGWVYKWNAEDEKWEEYAHLPPGTYANQHPLWQKPVKAVRAVSDNQVDKAIRSIMKTAQKS